MTSTNPTPPATPPPIQSPPHLQRVRHLPEWETPSHPPKRPYLNLSRTKITRTWRRSRLYGYLRPNKPRPRSFFPASHESLEKGTVNTRTSFNIPTPPPSYKPRRILGLSRNTFIFLLILTGLFLAALSLGLGLGLGLKHHAPALPLPNGEKTIYEGDLTYFKPGLGACGWANNVTEAVCAVGHELFDAAGNGEENPNGNPLCGRIIRVMRDFVESGRGEVSVDVMVVDRCEGCGAMDLDLSSGVFDLLASESKGRVGGRWMWL